MPCPRPVPKPLYQFGRMSLRCTSPHRTLIHIEGPERPIRPQELAKPSQFDLAVPPHAFEFKLAPPTQAEAIAREPRHDGSRHTLLRASARDRTAIQSGSMIGPETRWSSRLPPRSPDLNVCPQWLRLRSRYRHEPNRPNCIRGKSLERDKTRQYPQEFAPIRSLQRIVLCRL